MPLKNNTKLIYLSIRNNKVVDASVLKQFRYIKYIFLKGNRFDHENICELWRVADVNILWIEINIYI